MSQIQSLLTRVPPIRKSPACLLQHHLSGSLKIVLYTDDTSCGKTGLAWNLDLCDKNFWILQSHSSDHNYCLVAVLPHNYIIKDSKAPPSLVFFIGSIVRLSPESACSSLVSGAIWVSHWYFWNPVSSSLKSRGRIFVRTKKIALQKAACSPPRVPALRKRHICPCLSILPGQNASSRSRRSVPTRI